MNLAPYIDHTLLKPDATPAQIARLCAEAAAQQLCQRLRAALLRAPGRRGPARLGRGRVHRYRVSAGVRAGQGEVLRGPSGPEPTAPPSWTWSLTWVLCKAGGWPRWRTKSGSWPSCAGSAGALLKVIIETALLTEERHRDGLPALHRSRGRLRENLHRFCQPGRFGGRYCPDARFVAHAHSY